MPQLFSHNDVRIRADVLDHYTKSVILWRIKGSKELVFYPTKLVAEVAARQLFPNETEEQRYARIVYAVFEEI